MNCKVEKAKLSGKIVCPANKSYTHRAIFLASLADGKSIINNVLRSADTNATIEACKNFGIEIKEKNSNLAIIGSSDEAINAANIDAVNSGTTIRIASAIAGLVEGKTSLTGDESLQKRPMKPLLDALETIGAKCTSVDGKPPITVSGKIKGGEVSIPGNISSQFISALMIVAPRTENGIVLNIEGDLVSKPYLDATIATMRKFGASVKTHIPYKKYTILPQLYKSTTFVVPSDFSSLALLLSAAVLIGDELKINVNMGDLPQGDESFIDILEMLGVKISITEDMITVNSPEKLSGGRFDLGNTPDLLPPLAIMALKTSEPIEIFNVKHARFKETDRIAILARELSKIGIKVTENEDGLVLKNSQELKGGMLDSENDHRLFMAFCIAGTFVGDCTVSNAESVSVSYPTFVEDLNKVGASLETSA
ncbi:MAG: 3-phosphoshikimate 1-carboxyvinyltransferase [Nitrosopumilaceae archaeon]